MALNINEITKVALEFPPIERAKLIEDLFESFESRSRNLIDKRWQRKLKIESMHLCREESLTLRGYNS